MGGGKKNYESPLHLGYPCPHLSSPACGVAKNPALILRGGSAGGGWECMAMMKVYLCDIVPVLLGERGNLEVY